MCGSPLPSDEIGARHTPEHAASDQRIASIPSSITSSKARMGEAELPSQFAAVDIPALSRTKIAAAGIANDPPIETGEDASPLAQGDPEQDYPEDDDETTLPSRQQCSISNSASPPVPTLIHGPSFLGLSGDIDSDSSYLLDEDEPAKRGRWMLAILAVVLVGAAAFFIAEHMAGEQPVYTQLVYKKLDEMSHWVRNLWTSNSQAPPQQQQNSATAGSGQNVPPVPAPDSTTSVSGQQPPSDEPMLQVEPPVKASASPPAINSSTDATEGAQRSLPVRENPANLVDSPRQSMETTLPPQNHGSLPASAAKAVSAHSSSSRESQNRGDAMMYAGERYLYGRGVPRDCKQALEYFMTGAGQQNPRALSRMGSLYATGTCVSLNRVMAYTWFSRALAHDRGNASIEHNLNMLWRDMDTRERKQVMEPKR
jgi:hypothetical protein